MVGFSVIIIPIEKLVVSREVPTRFRSHVEFFLKKKKKKTSRRARGTKSEWRTTGRTGRILNPVVSDVGTGKRQGRGEKEDSRTQVEAESVFVLL